ncbi:MAG: aconitase X swivel domain-containing protein [Kiloniellales bacterium]
MGLTLQGRPLIDGDAQGPLLRLAAPLSFWGGVDPQTGVIIQPRHPDHRASIAGTILAIPRTVGSSSSSAVLLELIHRGKAPKAILLGEPDAITALGVLVAQEMGFGSLPVIQVTLDGLQSGMRLRVALGGRIQEIA